MEWTRAVVVMIGLSLLVVACGQEAEDHAPNAADGVPLAPGYGPLGFEAPEPGTYDLPPLGDVKFDNVAPIRQGKKYESHPA